MRAFNELEVSYHIGGSVASSALGVFRATADVDLVADLSPGHVVLLAASLQDSYFIDEAMIHEAIIDRSSFNLVHLPTAIKLDVFLPHSDPYDQSEAQRARELRGEHGGQLLPLRVASAEDTVLRKLMWYRAGGEVSEQQWLDVLGVLKVQWPQLDRDYLREWAPQLDVADLLDEALTEAERWA